MRGERWLAQFGRFGRLWYNAGRGSKSSKGGDMACIRGPLGAPRFIDESIPWSKDRPDRSVLIYERPAWALNRG